MFYRFLFRKLDIRYKTTKNFGKNKLLHLKLLHPHFSSPINIKAWHYVMLNFPVLLGRNLIFLHREEAHSVFTALNHLREIIFTSEQCWHLVKNSHIFLAVYSSITTAYLSKVKNGVFCKSQRKLLAQTCLRISLKVLTSKTGGICWPLNNQRRSCKIE